jgi:peptidoglycan/xylan/chitin deacetylase (PgdA/CDA1 family)
MILLYHLVFPDSTPSTAWNAGNILRLSSFQKQMLWLKRHFSIVPLTEYTGQVKSNPAYSKNHFTITFDDGYHQVFDLVSPFLIQQGIPATFFVTSSHLQDNRLLWFVYLNALSSENIYQSLEIDGSVLPLTDAKSKYSTWKHLIHLARLGQDPLGFVQKISEKYPLPEAVFRKYAGLTLQQMASFGKTDLLTLGGHTHSHPYLDQLPASGQEEQMRINKTILEEASGKPVHYFAYTGGIYNPDSILAVKRVGFQAALAVRPLRLGDDPLLELPRTGVYSPSMLKFIPKALGLGELLGEVTLK